MALPVLPNGTTHVVGGGLRVSPPRHGTLSRKGHRHCEQTGFDVLTMALNRVLSRVEADTLEEKWAIVAGHLDNLGDTSGMDRLEVARLNECLSESPSLQVIERALEVILSVVETARPIFRETVAHFRRIFRLVSESLPASRRGSEPNFGKDDQPSSFFISESFKVVEAKKGGIRVLGRAVDMWKMEYLAKVFKAWRVVSRELRKNAALQTLHNAAEKDKATMTRELHDTVARAKAAEKSLDAAKTTCRKLEEELDEVKAEVAFNKEMMANLENQLATLREEHEKVARDHSLKKEELSSERDERARLTMESMELQRMLAGLVSTVLVGTKQEDRAIKEVLPDIEAWSAQSDSPETLHLNPLLIGWLNKCIMDDPRGKTLILNEEYGFIDSEKELPAIFLALNHIAPNLVPDDEVDRFLMEVDPMKQADILLATLQMIGVPSTATSIQLAHNDGRGNIARQQLVAAVLLRCLDLQGSQGEGPRFHPRASTPNEIDSPAPEWLRSQNWDDEEDGAMDLTLAPPSVWQSRLDQLRLTLGRIRRARRALEVSMRHEVLLAMRDPEGQALTPAEKMEEGAYTKLPAATFDPASLSKMGLPVTVNPEDVIFIRPVLVKHFRHLRRIYKYYSTITTLRKTEKMEANAMSRSELERFLTDCELLDVEEKRSDKRIDGFGWHELDKLWCDVPDGKMTSTNFVAFLGRVAAVKFSNTEMSLDAKLEVLLTDYILPNASYISTAEFKELIYHESTMKLFALYRPKLLKVFNHYSTDDRAKKGGKQIQQASFRQFTLDTKLIEEGMTHYSLQQIFAKMQETDDLGVTFTEFLEILCAIATYRDPAPYVPLHIRVRHLLDNTIIANLKAKLRLSAVKGHRGSNQASRAVLHGSSQRRSLPQD